MQLPLVSLKNYLKATKNHYYGIAVDSRCRGQGIGSKLLDQIIQYALENRFETVRLDVIDSNPRAKKLYESKGFVAIKSESYPYLKWLIGFSGSTTMELNIERNFSKTQ